MAIKKIVWLGHASFLFYLKESVVALDPWFVGNPSFPKDFKLPKIDYVLLTHGHQDHLGDTGVILEKNKEAKVVAQFELSLILQKLYKLPLSKVIGVNVGGSVKIDEIEIKAVNAAHSNSIMVNDEIVGLGSAMGFVISDNKNTFYFAGDTALFMDMKIIGDTFDITHAMLPIGGTFTMSYKEVPYAVKLLNARCVIPMHYNTFEAIKVDVDDFKKLCKENDIQAHVLEAGKEFDVL
ncbi:MAG: metal-dependent hydrolase [Bdellovibrionota bacterium]